MRPDSHQDGSVRASVIGVAALVGIALAGFVALSSEDGAEPDGQPARAAFSTNDPLARTCDLGPEILTRIARGHDPVRSEDITIVPREPNFLGGFDLTSHSGPWDYLQRVPLVLYGPEHIRAAGEIDRPVDITDVYPTIGELLGADLEQRNGKLLREAVARTTDEPPKLVLVIMWDGAGRNVLRQWPDKWPNLRRLMSEGTAYSEATVGSSPSITSVTHSSLGTGEFPRRHGITGNDLRTKTGRLQTAFSGTRADALRLPTFADEIDQNFANDSLVGLLGWKGWHIGMLGHGAGIEGGDRDTLALMKYGEGVELFGNQEIYEVPDTLPSVTDVEERVRDLDRGDGRLDGRWRGHDVTLEPGQSTWTTYSNPAWATFQSDTVTAMLNEGGYGSDEIPDLFFTNFKMTDLAGHQWGIEAPEMGEVLAAQDRALGRIVSYLERSVTDFVVLLTADHGHAPSAASSGAWPISQKELIADVDRRFDTPPDESLVAAAPAYGLFLNRRLMDRLGLAEEEVARFLNSYTLRDNWADRQLPSAYGRRGDEQILSAAFGSGVLKPALACAEG